MDDFETIKLMYVHKLQELLLLDEMMKRMISEEEYEGFKAQLPRFNIPYDECDGIELMRAHFEFLNMGPTDILLPTEEDEYQVSDNLN